MTSSLRETIRGATLIGLDNSVRALVYAVRRARLDAREQRQGRPGPDRRRVEPSTGTPGYAEPVEAGLRVVFDHATLQVRFLAAGGVFVGWQPRPDSAATDLGGELRALGPGPSYALTGEVYWADDVTVEENEDQWLLSRSGLCVRISSDGTLTFLLDDEPIRTDEPPRWCGREWRSKCRLGADTGVFGLGGRASRPNHGERGGSFRLWNTEPGGSWTDGTDPLSITMPTYLTVDAAGATLAFFDNAFDGEVVVADRTVELRLDDGPLRYYVFAGSLPGVFEEFAALTGRPALPPRWGLGYHHAKWGFHTERAVRAMVTEFRRRDLPLSGVWLDIDHLRDKAAFTVDTERFPDISGLSEWLEFGDTHLVVIVDPGVPYRSGNQVYESGMARGVFCRDVNGNVSRGVVWPGATAYPDFTSPRAREWWGEQYQWYLEHGVRGFWHDMNEPSAFVAFGDPTLPLSTRHELDGRGGDHREAHNVYGLQMNRAAYQTLTAEAPGRRPFLISRSGWVGMQRYAGAWSGDVATSWEAMRASLWFTLGLSMSGVPYSGPDIGGFDGHPDPELFARWFQLAGYLPFFRTHSSFRMPPREPWAWPESVQAVLRTALEERYALLPYWYSLVHQASRSGVPYVRPLCWADPADPLLRKVDDAFLLGDAMLVAPVLSPGASQRKVRLPAGRWYDRRDGTRYQGPGEVTVPGELSDPVPVLVRAGSVIPVSDGDELVLEAYRPDEQSGRPGSVRPGGELYTDHGDGWEEPTLERFTVHADRVEYDGPADNQPYPVRWIPSAAR